uniref:SKP1 component POZ domain-containing protein n=1 Tax=Chenopodium quinoa TaxID=63459 RepID=A0A803MWW1_CHEQI
MASSSSSPPSSKKFTLRTFEGEVFKSDKNAARLSQTLKHMIKDLSDCNNLIQVPNVDSKILSKIIKYCNKHVVDNPESETTKDEIRQWHKDFLKVDQETLFKLILVIEYCKMYEAKRTCRDAYDGIIKSWEEKFMEKLDQDTLFDVMLEDVQKIATVTQFPDGVVVKIPSSMERADWTAPVWVCFFEYPFVIGHTFPFSSVVRQFLSRVRVFPCQLLPQNWKVLRILDLLSAKLGIELDVRDLCYPYTIRTSGKGRVGLRLKDSADPLVTDLEKALDKKWYYRFFFVRIYSLGDDNDFLIDTIEAEDTSRSLRSHDLLSSSSILGRIRSRASSKGLENVPANLIPLRSAPPPPPPRNNLKRKF